MTEIHLDPRGVEAAIKAVENLDPDWSAKLVTTVATEAVEAYVAEALRLRPMSEAPVGDNVLWKFPGWELFIGYRNNADCVETGDGDAHDWPIKDAEGWLPVPVPTEPRP